MSAITASIPELMCALSTGVLLGHTERHQLHEEHDATLDNTNYLDTRETLGVGTGCVQPADSQKGNDVQTCGQQAWAAKAQQDRERLGENQRRNTSGLFTLATDAAKKKVVEVAKIVDWTECWPNKIGDCTR